MSIERSCEVTVSLNTQASTLKPLDILKEHTFIE